MNRVSPWVRRWSDSCPLGLSRSHYDALCGVAREIEHRTTFFVFLDHRHLRLVVGPEHSPWVLWGDKVFFNNGRERTYTRPLEAFGVEQIIRLCHLAHRKQRDKDRWGKAHEQRADAAERQGREAAGHRAREAARREFNAAARNRIYA